jgi:hypothetical protein
VDSLLARCNTAAGAHRLPLNVISVRVHGSKERVGLVKRVRPHTAVGGLLPRHSSTCAKQQQTTLAVQGPLRGRAAAPSARLTPRAIKVLGTVTGVVMRGQADAAVATGRVGPMLTETNRSSTQLPLLPAPRSCSW